MKKLLGSMKKPKHSAGETRSNGIRNSVAVPTGDGPEAVIYREVQAFCESGAPGSQTSGDEYLHLPAIVDAAESSPSAANQAAVRIRSYLGKDHYDRGFAQYNAIMLTRILTDNPGRVFTQNFDKEFVLTVKRLLRDGKDSSVQQILRETLDYLEVKSNENDTLKPLIEMWKKEKGRSGQIIYTRSGVNNRAPVMPSRPRGLPPPEELAGRIEEAKTTARLLVQTIQSTPINELLANDLVREFAERARSAQKSVQGYMNAENPHPDDDTMLTLIETSEQLNVAMTKHQRAVLQARKAAGGATPSPQPQENSAPDYMTGGDKVYGQTLQPQPQRPPQQQWSDQQYQPNLAAPVINGQGRKSPRNEQFSPPPGPPPGQPANSVYSSYQTQPMSYSAPPANVDPQAQELAVPNNAPAALAYDQAYQTTASRNDVSPQKPSYHVHTASAEYNVAENPFSDAAGYDQPTAEQKYSLFARESGRQQPYDGPTTAYSQPNTETSYSGRQQPQGGQTTAYSQPNTETTYSELEATPQRPGAYNQGFTSTPSYIHRQDSAAAHITMHGASPPPDARR